jgi:hypothetical protein
MRDINYYLAHNLRTRINRALKNNSKFLTTLYLIGCTIDQLKQHLESQFKEDMNWDNLGRGWHSKGMQEWHVDHIRPCASFNLSNPEEQKKCFHYTNLQPLWAHDNLTKSNR